MLNNFIGGGQVFLHKIRMFMQVFKHSVTVALIIGSIIGIGGFYPLLMSQDLEAAYSYRKAYLADSFDDGINPIRKKLNPHYNDNITFVDAKSKAGIYKQNVDPRLVMKLPVFKKANIAVMSILTNMSYLGGASATGVFFIIFLLWWKFGDQLKADKKKEGSSRILTAKEVKNKLHTLKKCSDFHIGDMPLVKDSETQHFLVTGSTGSGKTNLLHNLLPQVESKKQPAIVIDQTGEMIAKYYNPERGDIIFNPFDARGKSWDFWTDCTKSRYLEKFADTLIGYNRRKNNNRSDSFWEDAAQSIFVACVECLQEDNEHSTQGLYELICQSENQDLRTFLQGKDAARYFANENAKTASSIMSVLMSNIKPLRFLKDDNIAGSFSVQQYIEDLNAGSNSWLFLAAEPSTRELTIPLNATLLELLISKLMTMDINQERKLWIVMDELAALGKLPTLAKLMQEGRKYGGCVISGMQSVSQLYHYYGDADASNLFGLFKTKFAFQSDDPRMGELYSKICGTTTVISQQKNTSFGANEFRDGVSYNEKRENVPLVSYEEFTKLSMGDCFTLLPETTVRLSRMHVPYANLANKNKGFVEKEEDKGGLKTTTVTTNNVNITPSATHEDIIEPEREGKEDEAHSKYNFGE